MEYFIIAIAVLVIFFVFNVRSIGITPSRRFSIAALFLLIAFNVALLVYQLYTGTSHFMVIIFMSIVVSIGKLLSLYKQSHDV